MPDGPDQIVKRPSPNFGERRGVSRPDMVVLHYTGMASGEAALQRLCDPRAEVSAHYVIAETGRCWQLVEETNRAWHAGLSYWAGETDINSRSIGIELVNPGHELGYPPFAEPQMRVLEGLLGGLFTRWDIRPERVVSHACIAPGRKRDPGEKLDWRRLARRGFSIWPEMEAPSGASSPGDAVAFQGAAGAFGYGCPASGTWDAKTMAVLSAFRARFRPSALGEAPVQADISVLRALGQRWPGTAPTG